MSYDFKEGQSAVEYGESLLASREKSRKKASKRGRQIKRVNQALALVKLSDMFLMRKANQKAELFSQQKNAEKAQAINDLNNATRWRTETVAPLIKLVPDLNIDDPDAFSKDGSLYTALYNKELSTRRLAVRGQLSDKGLSIEDREQISNSADLQLKNIKKNYNKYKGYLGLTPELLKSNYESVIKSGVRDIKHAKNTSSIRRLLGKLNIGTTLDKELVESSTKGVYIPKDEHQFLNDRKAAKANFDKIMEGTDEESKSKREAINAYWEGRPVDIKPEKIPALTSENRDHLDSFFYNKEGDFDGSWIDDAGVPRVEEGITWELLFNDRMGERDRRNLYTNVKTELQRIQADRGKVENYIITDDDIIVATRNVMALDVVARTEPVGLAGRREKIMYSVNPIFARPAPPTPDNGDDTDKGTDKGTGGTDGGPPPPSTIPFETKISIFQSHIKDKGSSKEEIRDQRDTLLEEHPDNKEQINDIYDTFIGADTGTATFTPRPRPEGSIFTEEQWEDREKMLAEQTKETGEFVETVEGVGTSIKEFGAELAYPESKDINVLKNQVGIGYSKSKPSKSILKSAMERLGIDSEEDIIPFLSSRGEVDTSLLAKQ